MESAVEYTQREATAASALRDRLVAVEQTERLLRNAHSTGAAVQRARRYAIARQEAEAALASFAAVSFGAQMTVRAGSLEGLRIEGYREEAS